MTEGTEKMPLEYYFEKNCICIGLQNIRINAKIHTAIQKFGVCKFFYIYLYSSRMH